MKISDIKQFHSEHKPIKLDQDKPLKEAIDVMAAECKGAVVVTEKGHYKGLVTERTVLHDVLAKGRDINSIKLIDIVRKDAPTALEGDDALDKLEVLNKSEYRHMAVLDKDNNFVGMLSQGDFAAITLSDSLRNTAEITKVEMSRKYQPVLIATAAIIYGIIVTVYAFARTCG